MPSGGAKYNGPPLFPAVRRALSAGVGVTLVGGVLAALLFIPRAGWTSNDITTGDGTYSDLTPRRYDAPPAMAAAFAAQAGTRLLGWKIVKTDTEAGTVVMEVPVSGSVFTDDLTVTVSPDGPKDSPTSRVVIRSHSRLGRADLGMNARHIRLLLAAMDEKLPAAP